MSRAYDELHLLIERASEKFYRSRVLYSPAGGGAADRIRLDPASLGIAGLESWRGAQLLHALPPPAEEVLQQIGVRLFRAVFSHEVLDRLRLSLVLTEERGQGLRLVLH